jgi:hypothetical protein
VITLVEPIPISNSTKPSTPFQISNQEGGDNPFDEFNKPPCKGNKTSKIPTEDQVKAAKDGDMLHIRDGALGKEDSAEKPPELNTLNYLTYGNANKLTEEHRRRL